MQLQRNEKSVDWPIGLRDDEREREKEKIGDRGDNAMCAPALGHKYYNVYMPVEKITALRRCENIRDRPEARRESMINKSNCRARQTGMIVICWDFRAHVCTKRGRERRIPRPVVNAPRARAN